MCGFFQCLPASAAFVHNASVSDHKLSHSGPMQQEAEWVCPSFCCVYGTT